MKIYNFKKLISTNDYLKENFTLYNEFDVISADIQTNGKARRGNVWFSNLGMALFTFYFKKNNNLTYDKQLKLPLIAGLSVNDGLNNIIKLDYKLKWPNDIYLNEKKLSGILIEEYENNFFVGIGINVNNILPEEVKNIATSLKNETNKNFNINEIITEIIKNFKLLYNNFIFKDEWEQILERINKINYLYDKEISLKLRNESICGIAKNIDLDGKLEILINDTIKSFSEGEVLKERIIKTIEANEISSSEFLKLKKLGFDSIAVFFITNKTTQKEIDFVNQFTFKNNLKLETLFINENTISQSDISRYLSLIAQKYNTTKIFN